MVTGIRLPFDLPEQAAIAEARRLTGLTANDIQAAVCRVSIDARRGQISRVYSVRLDAPFDEKAFAEKLQMPFVRYKPNTKIVIPHGEKRLEHRPVVVGLGPAGLFAAYVLAKHGYRPLVLERGGDLDERDKVVDAFWKGGALDTDCNIQFGEGGAGAYSDGKLTTRIGDPLCDNVLEILAAHGAPADIVKKAKPHVGTDILKNVVREMRREIIKNGGEVRFRTPLTGVSVKMVRSAPSRQTGRTSPASGRCWPSVTRRATPLPRCTETACTLSRRRSLWACASSTCRPRSTALCTERRRDIPCCRLRSTISRAEPTDARAIPSACARAVWSLRHRAKRTRSSPTA